MKYDPTHNAGRRAPAVALISMAVLGLLMFFLAAFAPAYAGATSSSLPTAVLIGLGAMLLGLSILGALALVLIGFNRHRL
jgi:hypothetical protein